MKKTKKNIILIKIYPANKEFFIRLKTFCGEILDICKDIRINPIVYGGLAYFAYTKDENYSIKDIDFLIPESSFKKIIKVLEKKKIRYHYSTKWHVLQILKGDLKIELDSIDFWQKDLKIKLRNFDFNGLKVKAINLGNLKSVYKHAAEVSEDKPQQHSKRFDVLNKLKGELK